MKNRIAVVVFSLASMCMAAHAQNVAILDIDEVARQLNVEEKVRVDLLKAQNALNAELQRSQTTLQNQMNGVEQAAGKNPSEEQMREIVATNQQLNAEFARIRERANQALAAERFRLIAEFQGRIKPIAEKAAKVKGFSVVLLKVAPPVFHHEESADITAETIRLAREAGLEVKVEVVPVKPEEKEAGKPEAKPKAEAGSKEKPASGN
ncbi:MAG TPA: OmpH family outer membrane protein [Bacteroidia bacterium]|nr:OmpH family outer membrane protein [Bacteroidia bacterium]